MQKFKEIITTWIGEEIEAKNCQIAGVGISHKNADAAVREHMLLSVMDQTNKMIERNSDAT